MSKIHFITGGAGFIGSSLADKLLVMGEKVIVFDNLSTGQTAFLKNILAHTECVFIKGDLLDSETLAAAMKGADIVWHFSANADVRFGLEHPKKDLEQNTIATHNVLEAMRANCVRQIAFSSTGSVYGEPEIFPTPEDAPFPVQTSLYAASKLACEGLIQAYCEGYDMRGYIFRFVSVLGERYTHGHVFDFCRQIIEDPGVLNVLGDGHQKKSYMYIQDCLEGMLLVVNKASEKMNIFNLGVDGYVEVNESIKTICDTLRTAPKLRYSGGVRGWIGDSPLIWLDTSKIKNLGWAPKVGILEGVSLTVDWLLENRWVFEARV